jgi:hypothetical protein
MVCSDENVRPGECRSDASEVVTDVKSSRGTKTAERFHWVAPLLEVVLGRKVQVLRGYGIHEPNPIWSEIEFKLAAIQQMGFNQKNYRLSVALADVHRCFL